MHLPSFRSQVETEDRFEWIGGSSIGGGTFWGLGALLTKTKVPGSCGKVLLAQRFPRRLGKVEAVLGRLL